MSIALASLSKDANPVCAYGVIRLALRRDIDRVERMWFTLPFPLGILTTITLAVVWATSPDSRPACRHALTRGVVLGFALLVVGYVAPLILTPDSNQGPLLGIFCTGPLGFMVGTACGALTYVAPERRGGGDGMTMRMFDLYEGDSPGVVSAWIDDQGSAVMVNVISGTDPVELNPDDARTFADALRALADERDRIDKEGAEPSPRAT